MKKNYVNSDHIHALIDLPTNLSIEEAMHLLKGSSSHWINEHNLCKSKFSWGRGYAALSVSESALHKVIKYIELQEDHHRIKSFSEEYEEFIHAYNLEYKKEH
jgi:REP element-mobilizing transposase RayT